MGSQEQGPWIDPREMKTSVRIEVRMQICRVA